MKPLASLARLLGVTLACTACLVAPAQAQNTYPNKGLRMIVPFGAGGPADVYARVIAQHLSEQLKQTFIIENRPGAGWIIGTERSRSPRPTATRSW